jgi:hypothetical protein
MSTPIATPSPAPKTTDTSVDVGLTETQKKNQKSSLRAAAVLDGTSTRLTRIATTLSRVAGIDIY